METIVKLTKLNIVNLFHKQTFEKADAEYVSLSLDKCLEQPYEDGVTKGLSEALNFVHNETDRQAIFKEIDKRLEA